MVHRLGFDVEIAEQVINHAEKADLETRYDVWEFEADVRRAQEAWGCEVARIVGGNDQI